MAASDLGGRRFEFGHRPGTGARPAVMGVVNLSPEAQEKALVIADQPTVKAEAWLFDPEHKVENMGEVELGEGVIFPPQSVTLFVLK